MGLLVAARPPAVPGRTAWPRSSANPRGESWHPRAQEEARMSLKDELRALRERAEARRPPEVVALMHRAVDELRASGAGGRVLGVGNPAPPFALPDGDGRIVESRALLARGPLVVTFYRGRWGPYCHGEL